MNGVLRQACLSLCLSVCARVLVCLSASMSLHQFLYMLPVAVARSSSGGVAIRYVLPVLSMRRVLDDGGRRY